MTRDDEQQAVEAAFTRLHQHLVDCDNAIVADFEALDLLMDYAAREVRR